ncbi:MAG: PASTA domain-containing protein [Planctomycetaceae bacterium]|nr:PASTA domain-containing protein [Planctomycetaceae bacterium]
MYRLSPTKSLYCLLTLALISSPTVSAQQNPAAQNGIAQNDPRQQVSPELWELLDAWAKGSSQIRLLHGRHERHVYDTAFEVEKISSGEFWYESPDKGRIDVKPIDISPKMIADRNQPGAKVERKKDGQPFELKADSHERWICDGQRIYDINDPQKTAKVLDLPPTLRGQNIMNSPLPFLFGLPPEKSIQRFKMTLVEDYRPRGYNVVKMHAEPKWRQDAENWSEAQIFLDTETFLPTAVKLVDPAGTKRTVYKFEDMKVNNRGIISTVLGKTPWDPKIDGYQIHVIQPAEDQQIADVNKPSQGQTIPNVLGQPHDVATQMLLSAGIPRENISKQNAGPAPKDDLTYRVREQNPKPGSPVNRSEKVVLLIFDKYNG